MKKYLFFLILCLFQLSFFTNTEAKVVQNSGDNSVPLALGFDSNGNGLLVFVDFTEDNALKAAYMPSSSEDQTFQKASVITNDSGANAFSDLAFDNKGNAIFVWTSATTVDEERVWNIYYVYRPAGDNSKFSEKRFVYSIKQFLSPRPQITFDKENNAVLIFNDFSKDKKVSSYATSVFYQKGLTGFSNINVRSNSTVYLERPEGLDTAFQNPRVLQDTGFVITTFQNYTQVLKSDANGDICLAWNTGSKGTRYSVRPSGTNNDFGPMMSMNKTDGQETTYVNLGIDGFGNTYAVWGSTDIVVNSEGSAYIPVQTSMKPSGSPTFGATLNSNLGVQGVNVLFDIEADSNLNTYLSMMNFNLSTEGQKALLFTALATSKLSTEKKFQPATSVFSQELGRDTVEVPFLLLNNNSEGLIASYFVNLDQDSDDTEEPVINYASIHLATKEATSREFKPSKVVENVPYFQDGPNSLNLRVAKNPKTGQFFYAYMFEVDGSFPIVYETIEP